MPFFIYSGKTGELEPRTCGSENVFIGLNVACNCVVNGGRHLACNKSFPDESVEFELISLQEGLYIGWYPKDASRPDTLMSLLCAGFGLGFSASPPYIFFAIS